MLLEEAFQTVSAPKKRTREEIVAELKKSRAVAAPVDTSLETAKHSGKFRPIGAPTDVKAKKRKIKDAEESEKKKKKKRKVEEESQLTEGTSAVRLSGPKEDVKMDISPSKQQLRQRTPSPEVDVDADIFADAEEWQGLGSDSESDGEVSARPRKPEVTPKAPPETIVSKPGTNWFGEKVEEKPKDIPKQEFKEIAASEEREEKEEEPERPMRLQGLASSAVPSIREILAMDKAAEKEEKRKARKEKKKEKKPSEETKINREAKEYVDALLISCLADHALDWRNMSPQGASSLLCSPHTHFSTSIVQMSVSSINLYYLLYIRRWPEIYSKGVTAP